MEASEAEKLANGPEELQDLQDENVVMNLEDEITKDIQADAPVKKKKRDRSPAQIAAFEKAQAKLREKRAAAKKLKEEKVVKPKKTKAQPKAQVIHFEESSSEEEPEPVVYVRRRKKKKQPQRQVVYYSSTSSDEEEEQTRYIQDPPNFNNLVRFV